MAPSAWAPIAPSSLHDSRRSSGLWKPRSSRAPSAPLRGQQQVPGQVRGGRHAPARALSPDGRLRRVHRARGSSVLGGHPGTSRVQSRPNRPGPLFREFIGAALGRAAARHARPSSEGGAAVERSARRRGRARRHRRMTTRFTRLSERTIYTGPVISLAVATFQSPDGTEFERPGSPRGGRGGADRGRFDRRARTAVPGASRGPARDPQAA